MKKHYSTHLSVNCFMSLLLAICFATNIAAQVCPPSSIPDYTYAGTYGGSTYFVSNFYEPTGAGANATANATGGHLVTIADAGENAFVSAILGANTAWIGFTDQAVEGSFEWVTGEPVTYTNWCVNEPNDICCGGEDWTHINACPNGQWNDLYDYFPFASLLIVVEFSSTGDDDCDDVANECDICPGGDDSVDNNHDGIADCSQLLSYAQYSTEWKCAANKLSICHLDEETGTRHTICVSKNAVSAHLAHGDWAGPCVGCAMNISAPTGNGSFGTSDQLEMQLTPNPASSLVNVRLNGLAEGESSIVVYDQLGKAVFSQNLEYGTSQVSINLAKGKFSAGLYFVRLTSGQTTLTDRLVVAGQ